MSEWRACSYFNSIKVRLKHDIDKLQHVDARNFNSIKVRLKLGDVLVGVCYLKFQFHKGTIKTEYQRFEVW